MNIKSKPCTLDYISSGYGSRKISVSGASTNHRGTDFPATGTARAMAAGTCVESSYNSARGYYVVIRHSSTWSTEYQHLKPGTKIGYGKKVKAGDKVGTIGSSGVGATHLHVELRKNGSPINIQPYLIKAFMPKKISHTLTEITGYNKRALAWRWYLEVARLQTDLKKLGYYTGSVDGRFETKTAKALKSFQRAKKLSADASVGAKTRAALQEAIKNLSANSFKVKTKYNMRIRSSASTKGKTLKVVKKGSTLTITKTNSAKTWGYCPAYKGWICIMSKYVSRV